jgi:DNA-directed RNA polymerase specialized sigma24 family protein
VAAQEHRSASTHQLKREWGLSESALQRLLNWLDEGLESQGETYLEMRRRLVAYFDRKGFPGHELADETLNRVARRLEEEGGITGTPPARYCYIVAKFILLEKLREPGRAPLSLDHVDQASRERMLRSDDDAAERTSAEDRSQCLNRCLSSLPSHDRDLIFDYYQGERRDKINNRQKLADRCGLTSNALNIRACRIRSKLETCVRRCMEGHG